MLVAPTRTSPIIEKLRVEKVPHVILQSSFHYPEINWVDINNHEVAAEVTKHLIGLGHRKIAVLAPDLETQWLVDRLEGYRTAMQAAGVEVDSRWEFKLGQGGWNLGEILRFWLGIGVSAIFCIEYRLSLACYGWLVRQKVPVPDAVSLVGFGDFHVESDLSPQLTTVTQPAKEVGRTGIELLVRIVNGETPPLRKTLKAMMVARATTGPCRQK